MKPGTSKIKFVKRAGMWVKTWFTEKGEQKQEWAMTKAELET